MTLRSRLLSRFLLPILVWPAYGYAQETSLHVLRPLLHAEQEKAEICLEFDHALDPASRLASTIHLESNGKTVALASQNISLLSKLLCLPSLEHSRDYRLTLSDLRGAAGEKLAEPYSLSFTIPDRPSEFTFAMKRSSEGWVRWQEENPVLRTVNGSKAHLELYRINPPDLRLEAWRQRLQTTLAPSESAYFARHKGELVWEGDQEIDAAPNRVVATEIPLQSSVKDAASGLYLLVASAPKTEAKKSTLAPLAAVWLLRSDLKLRAVAQAEGFTVFTEKADASGVVANVPLKLMDRRGEVLAEGRTNAEGIALLPVPANRRDDSGVLTGVTDTGALDFVDLTETITSPFVLPNREAAVISDQPFYAPEAPVTLTVAAHDLHNRPLLIKDSRLELRRPDQGFFATFPVAETQNGMTPLSFPAPVPEGIWTARWLQADGNLLAQTDLRVTANLEAPHLDVTAEPSVLSPHGDVTLTLKGVTHKGAPAPWMTGQIEVTWITPEQPFPEWPSTHFGVEKKLSDHAVPVASFLLDEKGIARKSVSLTPPDDGAPLHMAVVRVVSDPALGAADPAPLRLLVKPKSSIVGIKPQAPEGKFEENSVARFNIIALDAEGKRRALEDLSYRIYEEGRRFDWYVTEGKWDYKPQEQQTRVGGGSLSVNAEGDSLIEWPVRAGNYRLEIANAEGTVLTSMGFSAGWGLSRSLTAFPVNLALTALPDSLQVGRETKVAFVLDKASMVTASIADDRIRKTIHVFKPQGKNEIAFTPSADWGHKINVSVEAETAGSEGKPVPKKGEISLSLIQTTAPVSKPVPASVEPFAVTGTVPSFLRAGDSALVLLDLKNNKVPADNWSYTLTATTGLKITGTVKGSVPLAAGQHRNLAVTLTALKAGVPELRLDVKGAAAQHVTSSWVVPVDADRVVLTSDMQQQIAPRGSWSPAVAPVPKDALVFLASRPLFDFPTILARTLQQPVFTTDEIAGRLEILHQESSLILQAGLLPKELLEAQQKDLLLRLLERQNTDGGFPITVDGNSDILSTSAALMSLSDVDESRVKPASELAVSWLRKRLENTWFDEAERPDRAAGYEALARANQLDLANLHYFTDTSADKSLPPLALAQLAAAFARSDDKEKASSLLKEAVTSEFSAEILPVLTSNPLFNAQEVTPALEKLSLAIQKNPTFEATKTTAFLKAMGRVQARDGSVEINKNARNLKNILVVPVSASLAIHNPTDQPVFLVEAVKTQVTASVGMPLTRHIYRMNGDEEVSTRDRLNRNENYVIVIEGAAPASESTPLLIHDTISPVMHPTSCILDGLVETSPQLGWLKTHPLTAAASCEVSGAGLDAVIAGGKNPWRIAYVAKADFSGLFTLGVPTVRSYLDAK